MTGEVIHFTEGPKEVDIREATALLFGENAAKPAGPVQLLWSGDVNFDGVVRYVGVGNDRDHILSEIGGSTPTVQTNGYRQQDVNLNGVVKYVGVNNDRDPILQNIGGNTPTISRNAQMP
jgi:hypothetical protein